VTLGRVKLVGPDGVSVEQVTVVWNDGNPPRHVLRLRWRGQFVGDYRTVDELARHVDLATLVEQLPPATQRQPPRHAWDRRGRRGAPADGPAAARSVDGRTFRVRRSACPPHEPDRGSRQVRFRTRSKAG
jgi:hypothetical protein